MEMYDKIDKLRNKRWELTYPEQVMPHNLKALRLFIAKNFSRHKAENNKIPIITEQDRRHKHENAEIPIIIERDRRHTTEDEFEELDGGSNILKSSDVSHRKLIQQSVDVEDPELRLISPLKNPLLKKEDVNLIKGNKVERS